MRQVLERSSSDPRPVESSEGVSDIDYGLESSSHSVMSLYPKVPHHPGSSLMPMCMISSLTRMTWRHWMVWTKVQMELSPGIRSTGTEYPSHEPLDLPIDVSLQLQCIYPNNNRASPYLGGGGKRNKCRCKRVPRHLTQHYQGFE